MERSAWLLFTLPSRSSLAAQTSSRRDAWRRQGRTARRHHSYLAHSLFPSFNGTRQQRQSAQQQTASRHHWQYRQHPSSSSRRLCRFAHLAYRHGFRRSGQDGRSDDEGYYAQEYGRQGPAGGAHSCEAVGSSCVRLPLILLHSRSNHQHSGDNVPTSGLAARRGPQAKSRNLTILTPGNGETPSGARSAPIRPSGFAAQQQLHQSTSFGAIPGTAYPAMPGGAQEHRLPPPAALAASSHHHHHHHHPQPSTSFAFPVPPTASRAHHHLPPLEPAAAPKAAFLSLFETFYDSLGDSRVLSSNLDDQLRRSAVLLTTLQQSTATFETLLDKRLDDMARGHTRDLQVLERRLERIEARLGVVVASPSLMSSSGGSGSVVAGNLAERVARVEGVTKHATSGIRGGGGGGSE